MKGFADLEAERSFEGEFSRPRARADFRCHCIVDSPLSLTSWFGPMRNLYQAFNKRNLNQRTPETVIAGREGGKVNAIDRLLTLSLESS